jgi:metal-responsive CopG/Arc/MetJ family transcriptional regulator
MARESNLPLLVNLRIDNEMSKAIDDWRRQQSDIPTRSEAIRRLVRQALKT